jgi:hypothetical protein
MPSISAPPLALSQVGRAAHDAGLAGLLGGNLYGRFALHPSVTEISDASERGKLVNAAWRRYGAINSLSLLAVTAGWVGARLGEAAEHVALGAHRVLHEDQPGRELVRALRLQDDGELAHATGLVRRTGDPADQLPAAGDVGQGRVDLRLRVLDLRLRGVQLGTEDPVPLLGGEQLAVHLRAPRPGARQLRLGAVQRGARPAEVRGRLVQVTLDAVDRPVDLGLLVPLVGRLGALGLSEQAEHECRDDSEGQQATGSHGGRAPVGRQRGSLSYRLVRPRAERWNGRFT